MKRQTLDLQLSPLALLALASGFWARDLSAAAPLQFDDPECVIWVWDTAAHAGDAPGIPGSAGYETRSRLCR